MNKLTYGRKTIQLPETWNDLTKKQLLAVSTSISKTLTSDPSVEGYVDLVYASKIEMLRIIMKMPWYKFINVLSGQLAELLPIVDFLEKVDLDKQLLPSFSINFRTYYGPEEGLKHSSFSEFINVDTFFGRFIQTGNMDDLHKLIAVLYRPKQKDYHKIKYTADWNGDIREAFNHNLTDSRAKIMGEFLPESYKWAILYFYYGFREKHVLHFQNLFSKKGKEEKQSGNDYGWAGVLMSLSGGAYGDYTATSKTNWFTLFVQMSKTVDDKKRESLK